MPALRARDLKSTIEFLSIHFRTSTWRQVSESSSQSLGHGQVCTFASMPTGTHRSSWTGCLTCRKRKVKCDGKLIPWSSPCPFLDCPWSGWQLRAMVLTLPQRDKAYLWSLPEAAAGMYLERRASSHPPPTTAIIVAVINSTTVALADAN
jgi:hypothetical protein